MKGGILKDNLVHRGNIPLRRGSVSDETQFKF